MSIVNRYNNFIFLKSHKTASTSSEIHLIVNSELGNDIYYTSREVKELGLPRAKKNRTFLPGQSKLWYDFPNKCPFLSKIRGSHRLFPALLQHDTLQRVRSLFGDRFFDRALKVTSIRNPWDALVSFYHWEKSGQQGRILKKDIEWKSWLSSVLKTDVHNKLSRAQEFLFYPYIFLEDKLAIDHFIYYEDLGNSFESLSEKLEVRINPFNQNGFHLKKSKRKLDYRSYFTDQQAAKVEDHFKKYLDVVAYKYDDVGKVPY